MARHLLIAQAAGSLCLLDKYLNCTSRLWDTRGEVHAEVMIMPRVAKGIQDLILKIQSVLWELEGYQDDDVTPDSAADCTVAATSSLMAALKKIQQVERSKLRVHEAELAVKRASPTLADQLHTVLALVYAELSTAEFAAKAALQKGRINQIAELVDQGYEQARNKTYELLKDKWLSLRAAVQSEPSTQVKSVTTPKK